MKQGKGMAKAISFGNLPGMNDVLCVLNQILLGEDRAFGLARRPGGVDEDGWVMGGLVQFLRAAVHDIYSHCFLPA